jgi:hypothetical protein
MQPDISTITDNFLTVASSNYSSNLSSTIAAGAATVPATTTSPYSDGDQAVITVEPGTANQATFTGTVSGNSYINCVWTEGNLAVGHNSGKTIVDYDSATHFAMLTKAFSQEHSEDGSHSNITATTFAVGGQTWASLATGWIETAETLTYSSAFAFTVSGDQTARYHTGTKIKLVQSSSTKYFYVKSSSFSSPTTTVLVNAGTDYTLANAIITNPAYSYQDSPVGFPETFNFTPTWNNISGGTTNYARFSMAGRKVFFWMRYTLAGAGVSSNPGFNLPLTSATNTTLTNIPWGKAIYTDTSASSAPYVGMAVSVSPSGAATFKYIEATNNTLAAVSSTAPFTFATTDIIEVQGEYWMGELA